jgi:hypothetical protein
LVLVIETTRPCTVCGDAIEESEDTIRVGPDRYPACYVSTAARERFAGQRVERRLEVG